MKSTFIRDDGSRLCVEPSHVFKNIRIWVPDRAEIITIPAELAPAVAQAIECAALAIHHTELIGTAAGA